jgi:hypothetical protein
MKNLFKPVIGVLLLFVLNLSCDNANDPEEKKNQFTVDGVEYELIAGAIINWGLCIREHDCTLGYEGYEMDIILAYDPKQVSEENYWGDFTGPGEIIDLVIFTKRAQTIPDGEYKFKEYKEESSLTYFDFGGGNYVIDWSKTELSDKHMEEINSGKVNISQKDGEYEISFNCKDTNGKAITGYYKGVLNYYE